MSTLYNPDNWQLILVTPTDTTCEPYYKILAGWSGSYMYGSNWKLSSGVEQVIDQGNDPEGFGLYGDSWRVPQSSGSVYILRKTSEGPKLATFGVIEDLMWEYPELKLEVVKMGNILCEFGL